MVRHSSKFFSTGYLIKIASMGQRFVWKSVVKYDTEYRKVQATSNFVWGADNAYFMQLFLRENSDRPYGKQDHTSQRSRVDPSSGREVCGRFNSQAGCQIRNCKYTHVCRVCYSNIHNAINHSSSESSFLNKDAKN